MARAQQKALTNHRRRQRARGLVRLEVQARERDTSLIKRLAETLRDEPSRAERLRAALEKTLGPPERRSFKALLASAPWDDAFERALARDKGLPRKARF